ncbi:MAG: biotin--[acetyl-CoA-carboxylase] ligase, partial [Thermoplasmata archaeon]|nr:biotin--[acetyl-CoA-carboxylase] ligase [Thermoplasmata archaeon]
VVVADEQMKGRGRLDREWISPAGGLYFSAVFKNRNDISLLAGVAVAKSLREIGIDAKIKWPNDIVVTEKKIAGILVEIFEDYAVVGIGVNMSGAPLPTATSVREQGMSISKDELLEKILQNFEIEDIFDDYRRMSATIGRHVRVEMVNGSVEGVARDIDEHGRLILECSGEVKKIASGDCIHLR